MCFVPQDMFVFAWMRDWLDACGGSMQEACMPLGSILVVDLTLGSARTEAFKGGPWLSAACNWYLLAG